MNLNSHLSNNQLSPVATKEKCLFFESADDEFGFSCKFDECAEAKEAPKADCAYQFTIDSCCTQKIVCDKDEIAKLSRCWNDGREYVKGNLIYSPKSPCYKCLCDEKFDNSTDPSTSPSCTPVQCGIELHQLSYLQTGCIPVYFDDGLCCPFEFKCRTCSWLLHSICRWFFSSFFMMCRKEAYFQIVLSILLCVCFAQHLTPTPSKREKEANPSIRAHMESISWTLAIRSRQLIRAWNAHVKYRRWLNAFERLQLKNAIKFVWTICYQEEEL